MEYKMQHQYWSLRRSVLRTLGGKEDECIIASDAELDAKLELFRSISDSCATLQRVLEQYQERVVVLSQEESSTGKFLRETGRGAGRGDEARADAAGQHMIAAGKAISFSGQQRLTLRAPLLRLHHEVETFRCRAVSDTRATVSDMERARGEYRAALTWMKAASERLDPDTGHGLDRFRKAQRHTKQAKMIFDKLTLDVLQKIDLLAAARCNMFSHVLTGYQSTFLNFLTKAHQTMEETASSMVVVPKYDFCILRELTNGEGDAGGVGGELQKPAPTDKDQMLFFQDEYKDEAKEPPPSNSCADAAVSSVSLLADLGDVTAAEQSTDATSDLLGLNMDCQPCDMGSFMPSQLLQDTTPLNYLQGLKPTAPDSNPASSNRSQNDKKTDMSAWFKIFAELDPLANPDAIPGANPEQSHAA